MDPSYYDRDYFESKERKSPLHSEAPFWNSVLIAKLVERALQFEKLDRSVVDVGCAKGEVVRELRNLGIDALGVEVSEYAIRNSVTAHILMSDLSSRLPFLPSKRVNCVCSWEVFEHIEESKIDTLLFNVREMLETYGFFVGSICLDIDQEKVDQYLEGQPSERRDESHVTIKSRGWWNRKFEEEGFVVAEDLVKKLHSSWFELDNSLDESPFSLYGKFRYSLFCFRKES